MALILKVLERKLAKSYNLFWIHLGKRGIAATRLPHFLFEGMNLGAPRSAKSEGFTVVESWCPCKSFRINACRVPRNC